MAAVAGRVFGGIGVVMAGTALWVQQKSTHLQDERKGSFFDRSKETALAALNRGKIEDEDVRKKHIDLVVTMSSRNYAEESESLKIDQLQKLATTYFAGYLFEAVEKDAQKEGVPVFKYTEDLPVCLPKINGKPYSGYVFSGETARLFNSEARRQILDGNYVRCSDSIPRQNYYCKEEVIIAGTTDCEKCKEFRLDFLKDVAYSAAKKDGLNPDYPLSDTPVINFTGTSFQRVGDLAKIPESDMEMIRLLNFTACPFYSKQKTRLSQGMYKNVGAIITGIENRKACEALFFGHIEELIENTKSE
ncbi:MAG: hypothetical protein KDK72_09580 [Chlamydiia bacterium]|nr:hypothetical protein [Chlamydiia bacterium]